MYLLLLCFLLLQYAYCSCPDGYDLAGAGQCRGYYGMMELAYNVATTTAIAKCSEVQAQPVIIHNKEEDDYWFQHVNYAVLLGLLCNATTRTWTWADGSAVDYKPASYAPDLDKKCDFDCVWFYNILGWYELCLTDVSPFDVYCTKQLPPLPVPTLEGCYSFEDDSDDGVCYQIGVEAASWQDAQMICKKLGANLASIHNPNENSFIRRLAVSKGATHGVFIGATLSGKGGNYGWIDGSAWDYENFFPGFPRPGFGDCVALDTSTTGGQWMNTDCSSKLPVACIRDITRVPDRNATCTTETWQEEAIMTSPGFPFDASVPCEYFLAVDEGKKVEVDIAFLEANSCCDYLTLYDGYLGGYVLANLTGEIRNATFTTSDSNLMRVSWQPKGGVNVRGMAMAFGGV